MSAFAGQVCQVFEMDMDAIQKLIGLISGTFTLIAGLVAALWAYTKFVLERGLLPQAQYDVECHCAGIQGDKKVIEILLHLKNLGSTALIAADIRVDLRFLDAEDRQPTLLNDPTKPTYGKLRFPGSLARDLLKSDKRDGKRGIAIIPYDTFVQPGVNQTYTFVTAVPKTATFLLVWSSFQYVQKPTSLTRLILSISRKLGLIQYSLLNVNKPHTTERVFRVENPSQE